jgi:L-ascorbate metabolism protein UlaG (beta-lactamase superfamily)
MTTHIRFLGLAAFEITNLQRQVILIDPCLSDNPACPTHLADLERVDLVLVTHLAADHLGDAAANSTRFACPVVCGVECHHTSFRRAPNGEFLSGQPPGFILYTESGVRIYHSGDSAIFSDLKLISELYRPTIGLPCTCELEEEYLKSFGLHDHIGNEMNADEGALAVLWLGVEYAIICHYLSPEGHEDVGKFSSILENRHSDEYPLVKPLALRPGEIFEVAELPSHLGYS